MAVFEVAVHEDACNVTGILSSITSLFRGEDMFVCCHSVCVNSFREVVLGSVLWHYISARLGPRLELD